MLNIINIDQNNFSLSGTTGSGLKVYSKLGVVAKKCEPVYNELFSRVTINDKTSQIVSKTPVSQVSLDSVMYATAEEFVAAFNEMINNIEATTTGEVTTTTESTTTVEATTTLEATTTTEPTTTLLDLYANLIAYYNFSETSGTTSTDLVGSADGVIAGSPTMDGTKFVLDGSDDNITYPLPSVITSSAYADDFSINIKFSIPTAPSAAKRLFYQGFSFTRGVSIVINSNRDIYAVIVENDNAAPSGRIKSVGVATDTVYDVTITWDATSETLVMYMDGDEVITTFSSASYNGNSSGMIIGSSLAANYLSCSVYEFSVFDKKLSDTDVINWINR